LRDRKKGKINNEHNIHMIWIVQGEHVIKISVNVLLLKYN
jgi:hypothetical protein